VLLEIFVKFNLYNLIDSPKINEFFKIKFYTMNWPRFTKGCCLISVEKRVLTSFWYKVGFFFKSGAITLRI
jgi:hypothetical protein